MTYQVERRFLQGNGAGLEHQFSGPCVREINERHAKIGEGGPVLKRSG